MFQLKATNGRAMYVLCMYMQKRTFYDGHQKLQSRYPEFTPREGQRAPSFRVTGYTRIHESPCRESKKGLVHPILFQTIGIRARGNVQNKVKHVAALSLTCRNARVNAQDRSEDSSYALHKAFYYVKYILN